MKLRYGRELVGLRILFAVIGFLFLLATISFLITKWPELSICYGDFTGSLYNIYVCLVPFFFGTFALLYLIPSILSVSIKNISAPMFEFLVFMSHILIFFPLTPLIAVLIIVVLYAAMLNPSLFLPQSFSITEVSYWLFFVFLMINSFLMISAYRRSRFLDKKR